MTRQFDIPSVMGSPRNKFNYQWDSLKQTFFLFNIFSAYSSNRVKIKYNLNPKIHTRSRKKNYSIKIFE
jgi:hypothetical protein